MIVTAKFPCMAHNVAHQVEIPDEAERRYNDWMVQKGLIQDLLPELSDSDREILLTGTCQEAWDEMFVDGECSDECDGSSHPGKFCR